MAGVWKKTLIYLGLAEEEEYEDYSYDESEAEEPAPPARGGATSSRRLAERETYSQPRREAVVKALPNTRTQPSHFHLVMPTSFNDAQEVGDKFRDGVSVLMNLQTADADLARRLVDFASGLAYGLGGSMQPVAEKVFLITPAGVQVSAEERKRFLEERGFFNQL
jgi:cell division inhibitor SepF